MNFDLEQWREDHGPTSYFGGHVFLEYIPSTLTKVKDEARVHEEGHWHVDDAVKRIVKLRRTAERLEGDPRPSPPVPPWVTDAGRKKELQKEKRRLLKRIREIDAEVDVLKQHAQARAWAKWAAIWVTPAALRHIADANEQVLRKQSMGRVR